MYVYGKECISASGTCKFTLYANGIQQRITIAEVIENEWFKKGYKPPAFEQAEVSLDDVNSIFNESGVRSHVSVVHFVILLLLSA